jgi:hypothetical protein
VINPKAVYEVYMPGNDELQTLVALRNADTGFAATKLKNMKVNRKFFMEMVHAAMDSGSVNPVSFLFSAYYQFWSQDVFNDATKYITRNKYYQFLPVINDIIDKVNDTIDKANNGTVVFGTGKKKPALSPKVTEEPEKQSLFERVKTKFKRN